MNEYFTYLWRSGVGKSTIAYELSKDDKYSLVRSITDRPQRPQEIPRGCVAYYTWDGTEPNVTSTQYTESFAVPEGNHVLSVILIDQETEKISEMYQEIYIYYPQ